MNINHNIYIYIYYDVYLFFLMCSVKCSAIEGIRDDVSEKVFLQSYTSRPPTLMALSRSSKPFHLKTYYFNPQTFAEVLFGSCSDQTLPVFLNRTRKYTRIHFCSHPSQKAVFLLAVFSLAENKLRLDAIFLSCVSVIVIVFVSAYWL